MKTIFLAGVWALVASLSAGCTDDFAKEDLDEASGDEAVESSDDALISQNAMAPNAMAPNAMAPNAMAPNAMAPNAMAPNGLSPNAMAPNAMSVLQSPTADGDMARMLVKYTVSCALDKSATFDFSWTDSLGITHDESYPGLLGIAPEWATGPLTDDTSKRLVSACLAARVNYYGVSVTISARSQEHPLRTRVGTEELEDYPHIEGAFWGNLFTATPYINACHDADNVAISRQAKRDCATGHLENGVATSCGIIKLVGPCSEWCQRIHVAGQYYPSCVDQPGVAKSPRTKAVITTALP